MHFCAYLNGKIIRMNLSFFINTMNLRWSYWFLNEHTRDSWTTILHTNLTDSQSFLSLLLLFQPAATALVHSNSPFQAFQAHSQRKGSGRLEACSLVKYLNYFIDVSTVINLPVAHPSSWPVSVRLRRGIVKGLSDRSWWGSCVFEAVCFDSWGDCAAVVNCAENTIKKRLFGRKSFKAGSIVSVAPVSIRSVGSLSRSSVAKEFCTKI